MQYLTNNKLTKLASCLAQLPGGPLWCFHTIYKHDNFILQFKRSTECASEWCVYVSHDGLVTCLECISASRFVNFLFSIFLNQVSFLSVPHRRLVFWAFSQGDQLHRWKRKQRGEPRLRLWYEKIEQHSILKLCHFRGRARKTIQQTGDWFIRRQPDWWPEGDFTSARLLSERRWSLWNVFIATGEESTPLEVNIHLMWSSFS